MLFFCTVKAIPKAIWLMIMMLAYSTIAFAQDEHKRSGWWAGIDAGLGYVELSLPEGNETDAHFYLGFSGGYSINPSFLLGIELSGWLYEASDLQDGTEGEGLSQVFVITRYYPFMKSDLFTKFGCGYVSHWTNEYGETRRKEGWGLVLGTGYDFAAGRNWSVTPFVTYNYGDVEDQRHNAISLGIGITWH